ncbi:TonB-dependent receptor [Halosquirtibacter laminarini]|uniref:TonB-dependent receptor n=1 Tax=Halosquirtibacter laminarini TaxID=3374600 RepID=A0AC61NQS3_9BACT|nr:TonB-dependent receptor [Prolixibacteraceae bacterium]
MKYNYHLSESSYKIFFCFIIIFFSTQLLANVSGQEQVTHTIQGAVFDEKGGSVPGVSIMIKKTTKGTVSDFEGKYKLDGVKSGDELIFAYIGLNRKTVVFTGKTTINVTMTSSSVNLGEVVAVGYASQKKVNITGAVGVVKAEAIENRSVANVSQAIQGTSPGLQLSTNANLGGEPGAGMNWNIRGLGAPYILVDGIPVDVNKVNPEDIESVSILKDAAAAAIYGSRAPNGVVLITTKKGKKNQKIQISYSNNMAFSSPLNLPQWMSSVEAAEKYNYSLESNGLPPHFSTEDIQRMQDYIDGKITTETRDNGSNAWLDHENGNANNDWGTIFFKDKAFRQKHDLSVRGGSEKISYFFSAGIYDQDGQLNFGNDWYQRYNFNTHIGVDITSWLNIAVDTKYARSKTEGPTGDEGLKPQVNWHNMLRLWPQQPLYYPNGDISPFSRLLIMEEGGGIKKQNDDLWISMIGSIEPVKRWKTTFKYSLNNSYDKNSEHRKTVFTKLPDGSKYASFNQSNKFFSTYGQNNYEMVNVVSTYNVVIKKHKFKLLVGYEQEKKSLGSLTSSGVELISDKVPSISTSLGDKITDDAISEWANRGYFYRLNYNYKEKYLLELNGRYDGSSKFMNADTQYGFFPSGSVGYKIHHEPFWSNIKPYINSMKLRGSLGSLGDQSFASLYQYLSLMPSPLYGNYIHGDSQMLYAGMPTIPNSSITWATNTTLDLGVDLAFLNQRLQVTFDWFKTNKTDVLVPKKIVPSVLGTSRTELVNAGEKEYKGYELMLSWNDRIGSFKYGATFTLGDSKTKWVKYPNEKRVLNRPIAGEYIGNIWGYESVGFFQQDEDVNQWVDQSALSGNHWQAGDIKYADTNGDKKVDRGDNSLDDHGDLSIIGNTTPRYQYGLSLNASYAGFDASIFMQGVGKRDFMPSSSATRFWGFGRNKVQNNYLVEQLDYWTPNNRDAYYPRPYSNGNGRSKNFHTQTKYVQDASYLRIKNIQVGYTFSSALIERVGLSKLRVYVSGENLWTFTNLTNLYDPEQLGGYLGNGKVYPLQKSFSFGLNMTL